MENIDEKEIQKTLEEMNKRVADFQAGKNSYSSSNNSDSFSSSNLKLVLVVVGVMAVLIASVLFYIKSGNQKVQVKIPPGYEIIYPKDAPPRLQQKL